MKNNDCRDPLSVFQLVQVVTKRNHMEWLSKEGDESRFSWYTVGDFIEKTYNEMRGT